MQTLFILTICLKNTYITLFILKIIFKSINAHKNHLTNPQTNIIITRINIFVDINQINKHKAKIYNHCKYTQIITKKFHNYIKHFHPSNIKKCFVLLNIRMINLSFDKLTLITQIRNISDYQNKSKEDLIKALSEPKPESKPKPETKPKPESKPKPEQEPKPEIRINKRKLKKLRKYFDELRQKFSKKEMQEYRKAFYNVKNYKNLSISEIKEASKNLTKLKKK